MSKTVQLQHTPVSAWGWLLGCWQEWDVLSTEQFIKCVPLSSRKTRDWDAVSEAVLYSLSFVLSLKNLLSLISRFRFYFTDFLIIIRYTVRAHMRTLLFTRRIISIDRPKKKKCSFSSSLVRFHLSIIYSCIRLFILLQHNLETGNS